MILVMMAIMMVVVMVMMMLMVTMTTLMMMKDRKSLSRAVCFLLHYVWLTMLLKWILLTLGTYSVFSPPTSQFSMECLLTPRQDHLLTTDNFLSLPSCLYLLLPFP